MTAFVEVADRVWVARQEWYDLNVSLVLGSQGLLVVDTQASARAAGAIVDDVRALGIGPVTAVFNTHEHFDHTFGNGAFRAAYGEAPIHAHEVAAERTLDAGERIKGLFAEEHDDPHREEVLETEVVAADHTFSSVRVLDLGDRQVELAHPGRGHTAGDAVLRVPDADVVLAGDLVEESASPSYGEDCHPLDWPGTMDVVLNLVGRDTVVVPGHGALVDRDFVEQQRQDLAITAQTIRAWRPPASPPTAPSPRASGRSPARCWPRPWLAATRHCRPPCARCPWPDRPPVRVVRAGRRRPRQVS